MSLRRWSERDGHRLSAEGRARLSHVPERQSDRSPAWRIFDWVALSPSDSPLRAVAETRKGWVLRPSEVSFRMLAHARQQTMSSLPTRSRLATDCRREGQPASPRAGRARLVGCESWSSEGRTRQIGFACFGTTPRGENNARRKRSVMADRQRHGARFAARLSLCLALHQTHNGLLCSIPHRAPAAGATQSA